MLKQTVSPMALLLLSFRVFYEDLVTCITFNYLINLTNVFESGELHEESVSSILEHTADDGKNYKTTFYNLDAIIAVGYRVNSNKATKFRIWATKVLNEFITKGFVLDDDRLKQGKHFGKDYFDELLERIREIRASERRFYQKITDIYSLSIDYDNSDFSQCKKRDDGLLSFHEAVGLIPWHQLKSGVASPDQYQRYHCH
jgi:hypothetical protein